MHNKNNFPNPASIRRSRYKKIWTDKVLKFRIRFKFLKGNNFEIYSRQKLPKTACTKRFMTVQKIHQSAIEMKPKHVKSERFYKKNDKKNYENLKRQKILLFIKI